MKNEYDFMAENWKLYYEGMITSREMVESMLEILSRFDDYYTYGITKISKKGL